MSIPAAAHSRLSASATEIRKAKTQSSADPGKFPGYSPKSNLLDSEPLLEFPVEAGFVSRPPHADGDNYYACIISLLATRSPESVVAKWLAREKCNLPFEL